MKLTRVVFLMMVFIFINTNSYGQIIQGIIQNKIDSIPISFANILVEGTQRGTISNQEGGFEIKAPNDERTITLVISVLGYKTLHYKIENNKLNNFIIIRLEESYEELNEVVVKYLSANEILTNFRTNYTKNYNQNASFSKAFYHSTFSENGEIKHMVDATVNLREFTKKKQRAFEVEVTQYRKSNDYRIERWNEKNNYLYDLIESDPLLELDGFLDKKNQKYYQIKRLKNTTINNEVVYVLLFEWLGTSKKALYDAKVYINSEDYALIKAEYQFLNDYGKIKNQRLDDRTYFIPFISGSIQYQKTGNYYSQKYLSFNNGWNIINNVTNDTLSRDVLKDEMIFTELNQNYNEALENAMNKWGDIYKKPFPYNAEYWNNQVKIPPTQLMKKAISDLEKHQKIEVQYFNNSATNMLTDKFENSTKGRIDSILSVYHHANLFNGVALITDNNKVLLHKAYGYSDLENQIDLDTITVFDIGSITKQFTTAIVLKLREEGKLKLKDTIGKYLPNYRYASNITIHELLAHRSGIPTFDYQEKLTNSKWFHSKMRIGEMITEFASGDLEFKPNSMMEYSNSNYLILTAIIEEIEEKSYYEVLEERIISPLKLESTYPPNQIKSDKVAVGYILNNNEYQQEPKWQKGNMKGMGCVYSTANDLLTWLQALNANKLLNEENNNLMKSPISYYEYYDSDFGYSWAINKTLFNTEFPTYFYGGTSLGFFSMMTIIPDKGINIILINNKGKFPRIELTNEIVKEVLNRNQ